MKLPQKYSKLTRQERRAVREQYVKEQDGKCMYCETSLHDEAPDAVTAKQIDWGLFPSGFLKYPVHLQHCHTTDKTEGAVHAYCNAVLWQYHHR